MGRGSFTAEDQRILLENPYVKSVSEKRIIYTEELKDLFIRRYLEGYTPHQIFVDAGFDLKMLGSKRIERAAARWRELCFSDSENKEDVLKSISERKTITNTERIIRLEDQVRDLQRKVDMLLKEKGYS